MSEDDGMLVRSVEPPNPREWPYPKGGEIGCNHCGRVVPDESWHVEWKGPHLAIPIRMHIWCHKKLYEREISKIMYGRDIFGDQLIG